MAINNIGGTSNVHLRGHGDHAVVEDGDRAQASAKQGGNANEAIDVQLTPGTKRLLELQASLGLEAAFDARRVESLRAEIEDGSYHVDAESTARRMLEIERGLFG